MAGFTARCGRAGVAYVPPSESGGAAEDIVRWAHDADVIWLSRGGLHGGRTTWLSTSEHMVRRRGHTVDDVLRGARGHVLLCPKDVRGQGDG